MTVKKVAEDMFGRPLGQGTEAMVFRLGSSSDKVLKTSHKSPNLRAEYVIFIDPQFQDVTPEAYDHHQHWKWITVEKVEPLDSWDDLEKYLPQFVQYASEVPEEKIREKAEKENISIIHYKGLPAMMQLTFRGGKFDWFEDLPSVEKEWFAQIKNLYQKFGQEPVDVRPDNLGEDIRGNLVVIDLLVLQ